MADISARVVKILIASPSDIKEERDIAELVIHRLKIQSEDSVRLVLEPKRWELDAASEMGLSPQEIINRQMVDECDCAICIFWTRIGTPTEIAPGGAVEELELMLKREKLVMPYFSDVKVSLSGIDRDQWNRLEEWKKTLVTEKRGFIKSYRDIYEFKEMLTHDLEKQLRARFCQPASGGDDTVDKSKKKGSRVIDDSVFRYQTTLKRQLETITLAGSPAFESLPVKLSEIFVSLRIANRSTGETSLNGHEEEEAHRSLSPEKIMQQAFKQHNLLLVIGDPGSGKTTLLKYYALSCLDDERYKELGFNEPVPVIFLSLRDLVQLDNGYAPLPENLRELFRKHSFGRHDEEDLSRWLDDNTTLFLLDGLDEISDTEDRKKVCRWIDDTARRFAKACFVVTSRITGYRKSDGIELEFSHFRADIMDFTDSQQEEFLHRWFAAVGEQDVGSSQQANASQTAESIILFLRQSANEGLRTLARVPLLLQIMAILWKNCGYLPNSRTELYDAALNYLLDYRDRQRGKNPLLPKKEARLVLGPVSLWMQESVERDEVGKDAMHRRMQSQLDDLRNPPSAEDFCENLVDRAGLLVEIGDDDYRFCHKTFREYLAGVQLVMEHSDEQLNTLVAHFGDDWWQEPLRFFMAHVDAKLFDAFMQRLFASPVSKTLTPKQQSLLKLLVEEASGRKIDALKSKLHDPNTVSDRKTDDDLKEADNQKRYVLECLKTIGSPEAIAAIREFVHAEPKLTGDREIIRLAARISGDLVDDAPADIGATIPRKDIPSVLQSSHEQNAHYILIKGGSFIYSVTKKAQQVSDLYVATYTVTNALYRRFITFLQTGVVPGFDHLPVSVFSDALHELASRHETKGFTEYLKEKSDPAERFRSPYDDDKQFNGDDQPVVGVSWYDATAYCLWLSLMESKGVDAKRYRLPSEIEWEWAAGGRRDMPRKLLKVRSYPWGEEEPSPQRANFNLNEGQTTPVGRYPEGATPEGLYDMAGNVWEWTNSWYDEVKKESFSLRGGSWGNKSANLSCSARVVVNPDLRNGVIVPVIFCDYLIP